MPTVNMSEAKDRLSELIDLASSGTEVIINRNGKPVARLTAFQESKRLRSLGLLEGQGWIAEDFDDSLPDELLTRFEGR